MTAALADETATSYSFARATYADATSPPSAAIAVSTSTRL